MVLHHHIQELLQRGHSVEFVSTPDQMPSSSAEYPELKLKAFNVIDRQRYVRRYSGEYQAFQKYVADYDGDFIITHMIACWTTDLVAHTPRRTTAKRIAVGHGYHILPYRPVMQKYTFGFFTWFSSMLYALCLGRQMRSLDHLVFLADKPAGLL